MLLRVYCGGGLCGVGWLLVRAVQSYKQSRSCVGILGTKYEAIAVLHSYNTVCDQVCFYVLGLYSYFVYFEWDKKNFNFSHFHH